MKAILLATALAFCGTAVAQDMTTQPPAPPAAGAPVAPQTPPAPPAADMPAPAADAPAPAPDAPAPAADAPAPAQDMAPPAPPAAPPAPQAASGEDPTGGYQPAGPASSGPAAPGQQVTVQPSQSPSEAFPPPAPLDKYPVCKKGQYDNCIQRGGK